MALLVLVSSVAVAVLPASAATPLLPNSIAAIGDSISQAFDDCCYYGNHPEDSWSTGWAYPENGINSQYTDIPDANSGIAGHFYDDAVAGAKVGDIAPQVQQAVTQGARYVTILIGANDVCTSSIASMTPTATFQSEFQTAMNTLKAGLRPATPIFVASIPNIYHLWSVLHGNPMAQVVWYGAQICQSMLSPFNTPADRQTVLTRVEAENAALARVCQTNRNCKWDKDATFNYPFSASQVSSLDYFHPNLSGQAALAAETWAPSWWPTTR